MVGLCLVVKWSGIGMWSENLTEKSLFMVQNVRYSNVPPSHVTLPFEYRTPILFSIQMNLVFRCSVFRWLLYLNVQYLDPNVYPLFRGLLLGFPLYYFFAVKTSKHWQAPGNGNWFSKQLWWAHEKASAIQSVNETHCSEVSTLK